MTAPARSRTIPRPDCIDRLSRQSKADTGLRPNPCPLYIQKRTLPTGSAKSPKGQKATWLGFKAATSFNPQIATGRRI